MPETVENSEKKKNKIKWTRVKLNHDMNIQGRPQNIATLNN